MLSLEFSGKILNVCEPAMRLFRISYGIFIATFGFFNKIV